LFSCEVYQQLMLQLCKSTHLLSGYPADRDRGWLKKRMMRIDAFMQILILLFII